MTRLIRSSLRRARSGGHDAGYTLAELAVAMVVAGVLLTAVGAVFVGTERAVRTVNTKNSTGADVRLAMEAMSRTLRVATDPAGTDPAMTSATASSMTFYALLNRTAATSTAEPLPSLVEYSYAANCLNQSITPGIAVVSPPAGGPYYTWPASSKVTTCLLRTTTPPAFTYYASGDLTATALTASPGLSAANLAAVRSVTVYLTATDVNNGGTTGVPAQTRVSLENLIAADGS